jgi:hypothetical protein
MSVQLKHVFTKTSDQDWSGVYLNVSKSRSPNTDQRDSNDLSSDTKLVLKQRTTTLESSQGYSGWDREYTGNNQLTVNYYFDTTNNAIQYFNMRRNNTSNTIVSKLPIVYDTSWNIVAGNTVISLNQES